MIYCTSRETQKLIEKYTRASAEQSDGDAWLPWLLGINEGRRLLRMFCHRRFCAALWVQRINLLLDKFCPVLQANR